MHTTTEPRLAFITARPFDAHRRPGPTRPAKLTSQRQLVEQSLLRCPSKGARRRT